MIAVLESGPRGSWGGLDEIDEAPVDGHAGGAPVALVVEADAAFRRQLAAELRELGVEVAEAEDGLGALLTLAHRTPDLVVLDMDLPRASVSGHRVFQVLRRNDETRHVPVVMLSHGARQEVCPSPLNGPLPDCVLQKPVSAQAVAHELVRTVERGALAHG